MPATLNHNYLNLSSNCLRHHQDCRESGISIPIPTGFLWRALLENFNIFSFFKARSAEDKYTTNALRLLFGPHFTK